MVKIRLTRFGKHKVPMYRVVATDSHTKRDGGYIALLGTINPDKHLVSFEKEQVLKFLETGAQPSETVKNLLKKEGIWAEFLNSKKK
jgi:small subunit ribosomal protein S16